MVAAERARARALPALATILLATLAVAWPAAGSAERARPRDERSLALGRTAAWLWKKQREDGSWRSEKYAVLRSGQAYTPFVLLALLDVPESCCKRPAGGVERALAFIRSHVSSEGCLGKCDPDLLEYPTYSTAYAIRCLVRAERDDDRALLRRMARWLESQQLAEANGFDPSKLGYGGFSFGARTPTLASAGHVDLAHARRVLEALRESGEDESAAFARSLVFLAALQRSKASVQPVVPGKTGEGEVPFDGGFYFSPLVLAANKGRVESSEGRRAFYRSYATATCDGVLALLAGGVPASDERVVAARRWLEAHPRLDEPEGIPHEHPEPWYSALCLYHLAARAEAYRALDVTGEWRAGIVRLIATKARADGSLANEDSPLMKEDDPILATSLATIALVNAGERSSPRSR